ncbi:MAG TPA: TetR/AcrR family transcriptional regulator [Solirubrobacterales bacterium]|jgi:AcrR family transcriptional regulator|nr:TetR/AcrR family transcriptional regulator [Solirubrobacterales bacterium]
MVRTPWGDAASLRERKLRPGRGTPREEAERNQRERLFAAMVATVAEKGYEATTVADLVELSGVSRSAFYRHFEDKQACFLAAVEAMVEPTLKRLGADESAPPGMERARKAFETLIETIVAQPGAAKMCVVEVYGAGPEGAALVDRTMDSSTELAAALLEQVPERQGMPRELVRSIVGGIQKVIHKRLYRGQEEELLDLVPQLWDWIFCYPVPPGPLKATRRRSVKAVPFEERQKLANPPERILRALAAVVADKGYPDTTVAEVVERASTSQRTFYEHFKNKEDAIVAALDSGSAHMLAAALPAFRRAPDWKHAVHDTIEAMFRWGAEEPEYARMGGVEMYAAGKRALDQREVVTEGMEGLLAPGYELKPDTPPIAAEAVGGALYSLLYDHVNKKGPETLPDLVPTLVYVTLAPFLEAEDAYEVAIG